MSREAPKLSKYVDSLQGIGRYVFLREEALTELGVSDIAFKNAARRLIEKKRIAAPRRGFYIIVPLEYRIAGAPPPSWYLSDLMEFHGAPYYVGLLSAAALHGAAHQQPQEFQVITTKPLRPASAGRSRIRFFTKRHMERTSVVAIKAMTGFIRVSAIEATAFDLVRYRNAAGHLGSIATVLNELAENMDGEKLIESAKEKVELSLVQRVGFLLDFLGFKKLTKPLASWVEAQLPRTISLRPSHPARNAPKNARWSVLVNERIDLDE